MPKHLSADNLSYNLERSHIDSNNMLLDTQRPRMQITITIKEPPKKIIRKQGLRSSTKIRFNKQVRAAREIPHLDDISKEQIENTWYTKKEDSDIKYELRLTIKLQRKGHRRLGKYCEELCFRGLEAQSKQGSIFRQTNRWNALEAVLHEQSRQNLIGMCSSDDLAKVYMEAVFKCRHAARVNGLRDAREVFKGGPSKEVLFAKQQEQGYCHSLSKLSRFFTSLHTAELPNR
jgi:hypothetical protein